MSIWQNGLFIYLFYLYNFPQNYPLISLQLCVCDSSSTRVLSPCDDGRGHCVICAAVGRWRKPDPVWFSDVQRSTCQRGHLTDARTHTRTLLTHTHLPPQSGSRACVVRRRRLNTKQTPHQTQWKFTRVAGEQHSFKTPTRPDESNCAPSLSAPETIANQLSKWRIWKNASIKLLFADIWV